MNERERFQRMFCGKPVDRPPLLEEGVRSEVIEHWHRQGLPAGTTHLEIFGLTPYENIGPDLTCDPDYSGRIMSQSVQDYRRAFHVSAERFPDDWTETAQRLENRDCVACIWAYRGFFQALGVEDWPTFQQVLHAVVKNPAGVRDRMKIYGDFCARMLELALEDVRPEFIYLSEPISNNRGPLISPAMYEEFAIPAIEKIVAAAGAYQCGNILVSTYGNTALLFPSMIQAGVTLLWISEAAEVPELDYRILRKRFGPALGLIGGIPLSILRSALPEPMRQQLQDIVVPLMRSGRYIPLAGGRVREDIPWEVYKRYREYLAELLD
jgi:uroporphyrinogen-III decarboxylase